MTQYRNTLRALIAASALILTALGAIPVQAETYSVSPVREPEDLSRVFSYNGSTMVRDDDGATMALVTRSLEPNAVHTAWFWLFNRPENCQARPCSEFDLRNSAAEPSIVFADSRIVGADGKGAFAARLDANDVSQAVSGPGLTNLNGAEIQIAVRSQGPIISALLNEQMSLIDGGCAINFCYDSQVAIHGPQTNAADEVDSRLSEIERIVALIAGILNADD